MERFCIRVRHERKRGTVWELLLYPEKPYSQVRVSDARNLGSVSAPAAVMLLCYPSVARFGKPGTGPNLTASGAPPEYHAAPCPTPPSRRTLR